MNTFDKPIITEQELMELKLEMEQTFLADIRPALDALLDVDKKDLADRLRSTVLNKSIDEQLNKFGVTLEDIEEILQEMGKDEILVNSETLREALIKGITHRVKKSKSYSGIDTDILLEKLVIDMDDLACDYKGWDLGHQDTYFFLLNRKEWEESNGPIS